MKILKVIILVAWLAVVYVVFQVDQMAAYGLAAITIWGMLPQDTINRLS